MTRFPVGGYLRDYADDRDRSATEVLAAAAPPQSASLRPFVVEVLNQGPTNSCVANAWAQAIRIAHTRELRQAGKTHVPALSSRLAAYYLSRAAHGSEKRDEGTYLRTCAAAYRRFGFCPESVWPFTADLINTFPPWRAFRASADQVDPAEYRRIDTSGASRILDIKRALAQGFPVVFGTDVSVAFASNQLPSGPLLPPVGEAIAGGHALCCVGFDGDTFDIVNSWSAAWGEGGFCRFSAEYLAWAGTRDLWILSRVPQYSESP